MPRKCFREITGYFPEDREIQADFNMPSRGMNIRLFFQASQVIVAVSFGPNLSMKCVKITNVRMYDSFINLSLGDLMRHE